MFINLGVLSYVFLFGPDLNKGSVVPSQYLNDNYNSAGYDSKENLERIQACETVVKLKNYVDDSMIFLIVVFACLLNTILQSWIPIFQGNNI